jgi:hypothetical protein
MYVSFSMIYLIMPSNYKCRPALPGHLLPPPEGVRVLLPPDDVRDEPPELVVPEPELLGAGELDTAGLLLPPDEGVTALPAGAVRVAGVARGTDELPELPDRLSGRL